MRHNESTAAEQFVQQIREEVLEEIAPRLGEAISAAVSDAVQEVLGGNEPIAHRGRPKSKVHRSKTPRSPKVKGGVPEGETYREGARGRKQCSNCQLYVAARSQDCPSCGFNFQSKRVRNYKDGEGNPITLPFYAKNGKKNGKTEKSEPVAEKSTKAKTAKTAKKVGGSNGDFGAQITDEQLQKMARKLLSAATRGKNKGISFQDALVKVMKEFDLNPPESAAEYRPFTMRFMHAMKRVGQKGDEGLWSAKAAA